MPTTNKNIVTVPCKPYVKSFLTNTYGNPVDLKKDKHIYKYVKSVLSREIHRNNDKASFKKYGRMIYREEVKLMTNNDTLKYNGFDIHHDDIVDLNALFEGHIKKMIAVFVFALMSCGFKAITAITEAQIVFKFSEDDMSTELIIQALKREPDLRGKILSKPTVNLSKVS